MQITDRVDQIVHELKQIKSALGVPDKETNVYAGQRKKLLPRNYAVFETSDLDAANDDGTVTAEPGETVTLCEVEASQSEKINLLSVGASDEQDVKYFLEIDGKAVAGGQTESPLGLINSEFSFPREFDSSIPAEDSVRYRALRVHSAAGSVDLVARMHAEVLPDDQTQRTQGGVQ